MQLRRRALPAGWYPREGAEFRRLWDSWSLPAARGEAMAVLAPHAGWAFSGRIAAEAWSRLGPAETIVVIGGHLGPSSPLLYAGEEGFETPLGVMEADTELLSRLLAELAGLGIGRARDEEDDNTVEVQLPLAKFLFPEARLLWLRAPSSEASMKVGEALSRAAAGLARGIVVVGSSDLTHYGPDYGFMPPASRPDPVAWLKEVNDRAYLDALLALDPRTSLDLARRDRSACSAGGPAAALAFALARGASRAELFDHATSYDIRPAASFVGYAALGFFR